MIKKIVVMWVLALISMSAGAQFLNTANSIDLYRINFGFSLGLDRAGFSVYKKSDFNLPNSNPYTSDTLYAIKPNSTMGFSLGLLVNAKINKAFDFRLTPRFVFVDRTLEYEYNRQSTTNKKTEEKSIQSTLLEIPFSFKFKSTRQRDVRMYVQGGVKYSMDMRSKKKRGEDDDLLPTDKRKLVKIEDGFWSWEAAIGADIYNGWFKLSPELKLSRSFRSVLNAGDDHLFTHPLKSLFAESLQLTFYFE